MLLTYGGPQAQRFLEAIDAGLKIVVARPRHVITLDIDPGKGGEGVNMEELGKAVDAGLIRCIWYPPKNIGEEPVKTNIPMIHTTSSYSGGSHVYMATRCNIKPQDFHDLAVRLGSDPARERYSLERWTAPEYATGEGDSHPYVMFERKDNIPALKQFYQQVRCQFEMIESNKFDRETMTYEIVLQ